MLNNKTILFTGGTGSFDFHNNSDKNTDWETVESYRERIIEYYDPKFAVK